MCSADIDGVGTLQAGSSGSPLPIDVTFTIDFNGAGKSIRLADGLSLLLYCAQPTNKVIKLSGAEASGQTVLSVDTDVTGDIWADGDTIHIDNIDGGRDSEERIIDVGGIAVGEITVTVALTNAKLEGALVLLMTRNIKIIGSTGYAVRDGTDAILGCEISGNSYGIRYGSGFIISGTVSGNTDGVIYGFGHVINGIISGNTFGIAYGAGHTISGVVSGNSYGIYQSFGHVISGAISGNNEGIFYGTGFIISGAEFNNTYDLYRMAAARCYNTLFGGATEFSGYNSVYRAAWHYVSSQDHNQVTDAFKAWCRGGIVTSQTANPPAGYIIYYEHASEDADNPCFRQTELTVEAGEVLRITAKIRIENGKDMTAYKPRLQIIDVFADPLWGSGDSILDEDLVDIAMGDGSTWQEVSVEWKNTGNTERKVYIRITAKHATGKIDEVWDVLKYPQVGAFEGAWK